VTCRSATRQRIEVVADAGVFVPAPEAEHFVEAAAADLDGLERPRVIELGTGCGAMGLALLNRRRDLRLHTTDVSRRALTSARRNAARLGLGEIGLSHGSLLEPVPKALRGSVDLLMAILPYVPESDEFAIGSVPSGTLVGRGSDGLGLQRMVADGARQVLRPGGRLMLQMLARQWEAFLPELAARGYGAPRTRTHGAFVIGSVLLEAGAAG